MASGLKPCKLTGFIVWQVTPEPDGNFSLTYKSLGIPFTPLGFMDTTWRSRDGATDRDGWDQSWRWHARYLAIALVDVIVMLLPWLWLLVLRLDKRWPRRPRKAVA